jgi:anti-sigma regulatory factor (Ser/Thr protein kinase)
LIAGFVPTGQTAAHATPIGERGSVTSSASHVIELDVEPESGSPRVVRRAFAVHFASRANLDDLLLCLSEVVTNSVLHAGPPIRVVAWIVDDTVRVEVADGSVVGPVRRTSAQFSPTGRGLHLLDQLALNWGVEIRVDGKIVWFEIAGAAA